MKKYFFESLLAKMQSATSCRRTLHAQRRRRKHCPFHPSLDDLAWNDLKNWPKNGQFDQQNFGPEKMKFGEMFECFGCDLLAAMDME